MRVTKIGREKFEGTVYNFHCTPNSVYFSAGLLVHNCYKANTNGPAKNMSFETFKAILDRMPGTLNQIAFGITDLHANPDFFKMLEYCNEQQVKANFTLTGIDMTQEDAQRIHKLCGAVAVSVYQHAKDVAYNTIQTLVATGMSQVNIHIMTSQETLGFVKEVLGDTVTDPRLKGLRSVVLLGLKPKGRGAGGKFHPLTEQQFGELIEMSFKTSGQGGPGIGFDSCSAGKYEAWVKANIADEKLRERYLQVSESCESTLFSSYINWEGQFFPCSFCEGEHKWEVGVPVLDFEDFGGVWHHPRVQEWRDNLLCTAVDGCRQCPMFSVTAKEVVCENA